MRSPYWRVKACRRGLSGKTGSGTGPIVIEHEGNVAVRDGQWKLVRKYPGDWELYDMETDRTELDDQAATNSEKLHESTGLYTEFAEKVGVVQWRDLIEHPASARFRKWLSVLGGRPSSCGG